MTLRQDLPGVMRRPNFSMDDAKAIARECPSVAIIDVWLGGAPAASSSGCSTATTDEAARDPRRDRELRRGQLREAGDRAAFLRRTRSSTAARSWSSARRHTKTLFPNIDPIGKKVRIGINEFTVIGVLGQASEPGRLQHRRRRLRGHPLDDLRKQGAEGLGESAPATSRRRCSARR